MMNEQGKMMIENLRREAMSNVVGPTGTVYILSQEELERFSELIVRRCAEIADENYDKGMCPVGGIILKKFGVTDE